MSQRREPAAYRKAIQAGFLPWNQRLERRAAPSTCELDLPAACLNSRPKIPRTRGTADVATQDDSAPARPERALKERRTTRDWHQFPQPEHHLLTCDITRK
jgi:hypothetical protein